MITNSPLTRRLTGAMQFATFNCHVHPHTSHYRRHFHSRFHRMQVRVFQRLFQPEELVQTPDRCFEGRAQGYGPHQRSHSAPAGWRTTRHGYRPERDSRHHACAWSGPCRSSSRSRSCDSRSVVLPSDQAASCNLVTWLGFSSEEVFSL